MCQSYVHVLKICSEIGWFHLNCTHTPSEIKWNNSMVLYHLRKGLYWNSLRVVNKKCLHWLLQPSKIINFNYSKCSLKHTLSDRMCENRAKRVCATTFAWNSLKRPYMATFTLSTGTHVLSLRFYISIRCISLSLSFCVCVCTFDWASFILP